MTEAPVRIVGLGSPNGCDAIGWAAVERLQADGWARRYPAGRLALSVCASPAQLPAVVESPCLLILIDALADDAAPGRLRRVPVEELAAGARASSHGLGVTEAVALIDALHGNAVEVVVLGIGMTAEADAASVDSLLETAGPALETTLDAAIDRYLKRADLPRATDARHARPGSRTAPRARY